ncbi:protein tyrosine phosphatase [bacterium]|nr:protein tyrosine phosphatase [bacterium]
MNRFVQRIGRFARAADGAYAAMLLCALIVLVAIWHVVDFSHDFDPEYPGLQRDHFSPYAPFAYRIAEPGDTLDLLALYLSALGFGVLLAERLGGNLRSGDSQRLAIDRIITGLLLTGLWVGSAPDPPADGWHGLSFQAIGRAGTPGIVRVGLLALATGILALIIVPMFRHGREIYRRLTPAWRALSVIAAFCILWRVTGLPDPEPWGYWPRWAMVIAMVILDTSLLSRLASTGVPTDATFGRRTLRKGVIGLAVLGIIQAGFYVHWLHWPIPRLKVIVPGQLYASAMPPPDGLALAYSRHGFKTIINLFNEDTPQRHRDYPAERAFAEKHGIRYIRADASSQGEAFVRKTLEAARDPNNWPVLVHCHGNMDRTPAWVGIYRFIDQGWSMRDILAAIERHRGYRPKGGVTVLYSDVLPVLEPDRWNADPVACQLGEYARDYARESGSKMATRPTETGRE